MNDLTIQTAADFLDEYLGQEAKIHHNRDRSGIAYADHHCEKEDDHTFWTNPYSNRGEMMYHPNSSQTDFDYLAIYKKDENGKWFLYE